MHHNKENISEKFQNNITEESKKETLVVDSELDNIHYENKSFVHMYFKANSIK